MKLLRSLSVLMLSLTLVEVSFAQHAPRPPRPPRPPEHGPGPRPPRPPMPAPHPHPVPAPIPRPRPVPVPIPRPIPRPIPIPVPVPAPSADRACFYEYPNYQGQFFCINPGSVIANLNDIYFNERISSAIIPAGLYLTVYDFEGFMGQPLTLTGAIPDMQMYGYGWDDNISSIDYRY